MHGNLLISYWKKIISICLFALSACFCFFSTENSQAAEIKGSNFSITIPDGWETADKSTLSKVSPVVKKTFDGASENVSTLLTLGWKLKADNSFSAAFRIGQQSKGVGKFRKLLQSKTGKEREAIADKFMDSFAAEIQKEYKITRKLKVSNFFAEMLDAGDDFIIVMDAEIMGDSEKRRYGATIFLHDDSLIKVSCLYNLSAPQDIVSALDAIAVSVKWD